MDYVYRDPQEEKRVGTVKLVKVTPLFDFTVETGERTIWCQLDHTQREWCVQLISLGKTVELAYPTDVFWNAEAIYDAIGDDDASRRIAYAVRAVFETIK